MKKLALMFIGFSIATFAQNSQSKTVLSKEFKDYWYKGKAEITSYELEQARYGEIHKGKAVNIFVTEPFSASTHTKADFPIDSNISVLKLNATKKFNTGIYPYSIMTSSFFPVLENSSIKTNTSVQEWCGHEFVEMKRYDTYVLNNHSYFQGESYTNRSLPLNTLFETDFWSKIRINPNNLPIGMLKVVPDFTYLRLLHKGLKAYHVQARKGSKNGLNFYQLYYPELERTLTINYEKTFPYKIQSWQETYSSGFGAKKKVLTTKATAIKSLYIDYWNANGVKDASYRTELGL